MAPRPGRRYYVLALLIGLSGATAFASLLLSGFARLEASLQQVVAPGIATVEIVEAGEYVIYYEGESVVNGRVFRTGRQMPDLLVQVSPGAGETPLPLSQPEREVSYALAGRSGRSMATFRAPGPGTYRVESELAGGQAGPAEVVLAVGKEPAAGPVGRALTGVVLLVGAVFAGGLLALLTYWRRNGGSECQVWPGPATGLGRGDSRVWPGPATGFGPAGAEFSPAAWHEGGPLHALRRTGHPLPGGGPGCGCPEHQPDSSPVGPGGREVAPAHEDP